MARNPDLIRTIIHRRTDDTARLVYADWLDENDDPKHAELIRVQCELAKKGCPEKRRKVLAKRESELLSDPSFHLPGQRPFRYARGFINEGCTLALAEKEVFLTANPARSIADILDGLPLLEVSLQLHQCAVLDRALGISLNLCALPSKKFDWDKPLVAECLRRITNLRCWEGLIEPDAVNRLTRCPHLSGVDSISFDKATVVPLDVIEKLFLAPALPNITSIHLDGEEWFAADDTPADDEHIAEFIARIGASEKSARLTYLQLNETIGPKTALALLDAPHLRPSDQLCLHMHRGLNKSTLTALKKRFGKALKM